MTCEVRRKLRVTFQKVMVMFDNWSLDGQKTPEKKKSDQMSQTLDHLTHWKEKKLLSHKIESNCHRLPLTAALVNGFCLVVLWVLPNRLKELSQRCYLQTCWVFSFLYRLYANCLYSNTRCSHNAVCIINVIHCVLRGERQMGHTTKNYWQWKYFNEY